MWTGAVVGAIGLYGLAALESADCHGIVCIGGPGLSAVAAAMGAGIGAGVGALIGSRIQTRITVYPSPRGSSGPVSKVAPARLAEANVALVARW
jgi:hypothetical protein